MSHQNRVFVLCISLIIINFCYFGWNIYVSASWWELFECWSWNGFGDGNISLLVFESCIVIVLQLYFRVCKVTKCQHFEGSLEHNVQSAVITEHAIIVSRHTNCTLCWCRKICYSCIKPIAMFSWGRTSGWWVQGHCEGDSRRAMLLLALCVTALLHLSALRIPWDIRRENACVAGLETSSSIWKNLRWWFSTSVESNPPYVYTDMVSTGVILAELDGEATEKKVKVSIGRWALLKGTYFNWFSLRNVPLICITLNLIDVMSEDVHPSYMPWILPVMLTPGLCGWKMRGFFCIYIVWILFWGNFYAYSCHT